MINKIHLKSFLMFVVLLLATASCSNYETYADQKKKERNSIDDFISYRNIKVITEAEFHAHGDSTSVAANEYVYMNNTGVYMQIVRRGAGKPIQDKENAEVYIRFKEQSIFDTASIITNRFSPYDPDIMAVTRSGTTYTANFTYGTMLTVYSSSSVPAGWLVPFNYINLGSATADQDIAKVRLIVPHTQGTTVASSNVYPYFYEMTLQRAAGL